MEGDLIKAKVKISKQFYPKDKKLEMGDYGIISVYVVDILEGQPIVNPKWDTITIKGSMCSWTYGEIYTLVAKEGKTTNYGTEYNIVTIFKENNLTNVVDQKIFLGRILTDKQIEDLYNTLKCPLKIIDSHDVESLCTVKGIGAVTANKIINRYEENKDYSTAYVELDKLGLSNKMIKKLCDAYGNPNLLLQRINTNPYIIADEVSGIGWSKADDIAIKSGIDKTSVNRVMAYIEYILEYEANNSGNSYAYVDCLIQNIVEVLGDCISDETISLALKTLMDKNKIWSDEEREKIALMKYKRLEEKVVDELVRLLECENIFNCQGWEDRIANLEKIQNWKYTEQQIDGIKATLENNVVLITGYGGTGKSSIVKGMLEALQGYSSAQCALSGKASVNLTEVTGQEGYTIHRLLEYNPHDGYKVNKDHPLLQDIIILDELSMVDEKLFYRLIQSIKNGGKLIMLGDTGQLESLGVGNIITDLIDSKVIKHIELTEIHRQAKKSAITTESIKVWNGKQIIDKDFTGTEIRGELRDLELDIYEGSKLTSDKIIGHFKELYKKVDNIMDLQVVVPVKKNGEACTLKLNNKIQKYIREINDEPEDDICVKIGDDYCLFVGDKVMNVKNNYKTMNEYGEVVPIMNGNMGIIKEILEDNMMIVDFERLGRVIVPSDWVNNIELSYCATCHKLQGSGIKYVICGLDNSHYKMRTRKMLYTMISRAKKYCVICGENKAIRFSVSNDTTSDKLTFSSDFLRERIKVTQ